MKKHLRLYLTAALVSVALLICVLVFVKAEKKEARDGTEYPVCLSEIMTSNKSYPSEDGLFRDYIELHNTASYDIPVGGFILTDGKGSNEFRLPTDTVLPGGGYYLVWCAKDAAEESVAKFGLSSNGGETVALLSKKGAELDSVVLPALNADTVYCRGENGVWAVSETPTPGAENSFVSSEEVRAVAQVRINEAVTANNIYPIGLHTYRDFVELYNFSDSVADLSGFSLSDREDDPKYVIPEGVMLAPGSCFLIACEAGEEGCANFGLSANGGETLYLRDADRYLIDSVELPALRENSSYSFADGGWCVLDYATPGFENSEAGSEAYLESVGSVRDALFITEIMASNTATLADGSGEFTDWLELSNLGSVPVNLAGWYLSDDEKDLMQWMFPETVIEPGQQLVVFCGGTPAEGELHADFKLSGAGESVFLLAPGGVLADSVTYPAADADISLFRDPVEDRFTESAYPTPGFPNDSEGYEQFCSAAAPRGNLAIWELMAYNPSLLPENGETYDWVELKNVSGEAITLSGYSVTDTLSDPQRYLLPELTLEPEEFLLIFLSGDENLNGKNYHAGFSLNLKSDTLYLFKDGELLDYVLAREIPAGDTLGRSNVTGGFFFMEPTPGAENGEGIRRVTELPSFSEAPGVYLPGTALSVEINAPGAVYYTLDGSEPTAESLLYSEPIPITENTVLRAAALEEGKLISKVVTASYIFEESTIPVVSLTAPPDALFGANGIYKKSWAVKEIEVPANLSYYGEDGTFALDCSISLHGMTSILVSDKKSFTVHFRNYLDGDLNFDLFNDGCTHYSSILLRADVEGACSTMMRDNLMGAIASECSGACLGMKFKYANLFINGKYWGIYCIREHYSTEYYADWLDAPEETCEMLKNFSLKGDALYEVREYMENHNMRDAEIYDYVCSKLDPVSFADWMILEAYTGNIDVNGNMRYFWSSTDDKWRCAVCDVDLGFFGTDGFKVPFTALQHGVMMNQLFLNSDFKQLLMERLSYWLQGPLSGEQTTARLEAMRETLAPEIKKDADRWNYPVYKWENEVIGLERYCQNRPKALLLDYRLNYCSLSKEQLEQWFGGLY